MKEKWRILFVAVALLLLATWVYMQRWQYTFGSNSLLKVDRLTGEAYFLNANQLTWMILGKGK